MSDKEKKQSLPEKIFTGIAFGIFAASIGILRLFAKLFPFERRKYEKSAYFRAFGIKYSYGVTKRADYKLYTAAKEKGLPLERKTFSDGKPFYEWSGGRDKFALLLAVPSFDWIFFQDGEWKTCEFGDEENAVGLEERLKEVFPEAPALSLPVKLLSDGVIAIDSEEAAKNSPFFLSEEEVFADPERALTYAPRGGLTFAEGGAAELPPTKAGDGAGAAIGTDKTKETDERAREA